jgi:DNA-directed RNA polymerase sigma subunit (sigma70/sigma32)
MSHESRIREAFQRAGYRGKIGDREVAVLRNRIESEEMSLQHLADEYGCSRQRIHQIELRIRRALRKENT